MLVFFWWGYFQGSLFLERVIIGGCFAWHVLKPGRWILDDGRWTVDDGRWTMDEEYQLCFCHAIWSHNVVTQDLRKRNFHLLASQPNIWINSKRKKSKEKSILQVTLAVSHYLRGRCLRRRVGALNGRGERVGGLRLLCEARNEWYHLAIFMIFKISRNRELCNYLASVPTSLWTGSLMGIGWKKVGKRSEVGGGEGERVRQGGCPFQESYTAVPCWRVPKRTKQLSLLYRFRYYVN